MNTLRNSDLDKTRIDVGGSRTNTEKPRVGNINSGQTATQQFQPSPSSQTPPSSQAQDNKKKFKHAAMGVAGVGAGLAGAAAFMSFKTPDEIVEPIEPEEHHEEHHDVQSSETSYPPVTEPEHFNGAEIPVAHGVSDDMSFSQAFAAARHEVGAGGVFEWH